MLRHLTVLALILTTVGCAVPSSPGTPDPGTSNPAPTNTPQSTPAKTSAKAPAALPAGFVPGSVAFWSTEQGLLAGTAGCPDQCAGIIAASGDGGTSWTVLHRVGARVWDLTTAADGQAWATTSSCPTGGGSDCTYTLIHSSDGGRTWNPAADNVAYPSFADAQTGWAVPLGQGRTPPIIRSSDGGQHWQELTSPCPAQAGDVRAVRLVSPTRGWVACAGQPGAGQQMKAVLATGDGGHTWQQVANPGGGGYLSGLFFLPDGHGWLLKSRGMALATADGGQTWQPLPVTQAEVVEAQSLWFTSLRDGHILLRDNDRRTWRLARTTDGGGQWADVQSWPIDLPG